MAGASRTCQLSEESRDGTRCLGCTDPSRHGKHNGVRSSLGQSLLLRLIDAYMVYELFMMAYASESWRKRQKGKYRQGWEAWGAIRRCRDELRPESYS